MGGSIMASIINASTSGAGGVITTADASGVLQLQSDGTTVINATTVSGNPRITGDFSNATVANRVALQTNIVDGSTFIHAIPNGTGTTGGFYPANSNDLANTSLTGLGTSATTSFITATRTGTGSFLPLTFTTNSAERMRIDTSGNLLVGSTTDVDINSSTDVGFKVSQAGASVTYRSGGTVMYVGRQTNDGTIIEFRQAGVAEGSISVSGTTVSYNGGHLSRWSQWQNESGQPEVYRGTVLESVDAMCEWYDDEGNLLPNEQATKTIVSTTPASKAVAGVFDMYDNDDEDNPYDFYVAQSGDFVIRVAAGTVVQNGYLLESAGDGTARVQADDICRSSTIAKVTSNYVSETYADGSFCVPCILMIG
jgi:hypothetical protein